MLPFRLTICGISELPDHAGAGISHVVSVLDPDTPAPDELGRWALDGRHDFRFHDDIAVQAARRPPADADVARLLEVGEALAAADVRHLLVHCWAGVSRSTAMAMALMAQAAPGREDEIPDALLQVRSPVWPNSLIIGMADAALGAGGRLVAAKEEVFRRIVGDHPHMVDLMHGYGRGHEVPDPPGAG